MAATDMQKRWGLLMGLRGLVMLLAGLYAVIWPATAIYLLVMVGAIVLDRRRRARRLGADLWRWQDRQFLVRRGAQRAGHRRWVCWCCCRRCCRRC